MCLYTKNEPYRTRSSFRLAEREGFEPPEPLSSTVFKTAAIDHSAISPSSQLACKKKLALRVWFATIVLLTRAHEALVIFLSCDFFKSGAKVLLFFQIHKFFIKILANMRKI